MTEPKRTLEMRVLRRAAELLGSDRALARRLQVPTLDLSAWMEGLGRPPRALFLEAIDVLIEHGQLAPLDSGAATADAAEPLAGRTQKEQS